MLSVGAYRDENGKPWVLPVIKKVCISLLRRNPLQELTYEFSRQASAILAADETINHEYLPIAGLPAFTNAAQKLVFGGDCKAVKEGRVVRCVWFERSARVQGTFT